MISRILTAKMISEFKNYPQNEVKCRNTIEKYTHDAKAFMIYANGNYIEKETVIS